jgi:hypothetical protein
MPWYVYQGSTRGLDVRSEAGMETVLLGSFKGITKIIHTDEFSR